MVIRAHYAQRIGTKRVGKMFGLARSAKLTTLLIVLQPLVCAKQASIHDFHGKEFTVIVFIVHMERSKTFPATNHVKIVLVEHINQTLVKLLA